MEDIIVRTDYDLQQGDRYRLLPKGDSTPTDPKWKEYDRQLKAQKRNEKQPDVTAEAPTSVDTAVVSKQPQASEQPSSATTALLPNEEIARRAIDNYYANGVNRGDRHKTFISETAEWLIMVTDNNTERALALAHELD